MTASWRAGCRNDAPNVAEPDTGERGHRAVVTDGRVVTLLSQGTSDWYPDAVRELLAVMAVVEAIEQPNRSRGGPVSVVADARAAVRDSEIRHEGALLTVTVAVPRGANGRSQAAAMYRTAALLRAVTAAPIDDRATEFEAVVRNAYPDAFGEHPTLSDIATALAELDDVELLDSLPDDAVREWSPPETRAPHPVRILFGWDDAVWQQLEGLLDRCAVHQGPFGEWVPVAPGPDGTLPTGYSREDELVGAVREFVYDHGVMQSGFDWMHWETGHQLLDSGRDHWHQLPADVLLRLITLFTRRDRFSEGSFMAAFDDGSLPFLLGELARFRPPPEPPADDAVADRPAAQQEGGPAAGGGQ